MQPPHWPRAGADDARLRYLREWVDAIALRQRGGIPDGKAKARRDAGIAEGAEDLRCTPPQGVQQGEGCTNLERSRERDA